MSKNAVKGPAYRWSEVREKVLKGASYALGNPFNYRHQLRIKVSSNSLIYTFWDFTKCVHSGLIQGTEPGIWEEFSSELHRRNVSQIPCVSVCISVWSDMPMLLRPESNASVPLDMVNRALREQPDKIRRDLQANGIYSFTAMPCDTSRLFIFGVPLGYVLKGALSKFPEEWAKVTFKAYPSGTPKMKSRKYRRHGREAVNPVSLQVAPDLVGLFAQGSVYHVQGNRCVRFGAEQHGHVAPDRDADADTGDLRDVAAVELRAELFPDAGSVP